MTMAVEDRLALLWIISTVTVQITAREIKFTTLNNNSTKVTYEPTSVQIGSNLTFVCHCENCSTIEYLKFRYVKFSRFYSGSLCTIDGKRKLNECKPDSFTTSFEATQSDNNSEWHCRGQPVQGGSRTSMGWQIIIKPTGAIETSTDLMKITTVTSNTVLPDPSESNQNTITTIALVVSVLVVLLLVITAILCLRKRKQKLVSRLNSTSPNYASDDKETPESRSSVCVMVDNDIYESNNGGNGNQDSPPETRKSICIMEANPLYEST